jgi:signal transduction histidine kinase
VELYEPSMSERGLKVSLLSHGAVWITGDAGLLHRMTANLFDNELRHLPSGSSLTIRLEALENAAKLTVEDNGPGFDEQILPSLFQRRIRGKNSTGHGLGLAFIDAVVRAHGGTINASNADGGGASIVIVLPAAQPDYRRPLASAAAV